MEKGKRKSNGKSEENKKQKTNQTPNTGESAESFGQKKKRLLEDLRKILSLEQMYLIDMVLEGHSVMMTGYPGTGKTYALRGLVDFLIKLGCNVAFTAMTGTVAAGLGNGATTLDSWIGGDWHRSPEEEAARIEKSSVLMKRWKQVQFLIIDEVSMLSIARFDKLNYIARKVRGDPSPWGGIKVVLSGDPFQLPPVEIREPENFPREWTKPEYKGKTYCFESSQFDKLIPKVFFLSDIFRQKGDVVFKAILNEARYGQLSDKACQVLERRIGFNLNCPKWIKCTSIYPHKKDAEAQNARELSELPGEIRTYKKIEKYTRNLSKEVGEKLIQVVRRSCNAPETVELKQGCTVIFTTNAEISKNLANGSQGKVVGFIDWYDVDYGNYECPVVQFLGIASPMPIPYWTWEKTIIRKNGTAKNEYSGAYIKQIPLLVANAMTVHKVQGMSLAFAKIDIGPKTFAYGQAYTALSRLTTLKGLSIIDFSRYAFKTSPVVIAFYEKYAGIKSTSIPDNSKLYEEELSKSRGTEPFEIPTDPDDYDRTLVLTGNYYEILSSGGFAVTFRSTDSEIKKAFRLSSIRWHPDKCVHGTVIGDINMKKINEAYDTLKVPEKRAYYNTTLK